MIMHIIVAIKARNIDNKIFLIIKPFKITQLATTGLLFAGCIALTITNIKGIKNKNIVKKIYGKTIKKVLVKDFLLIGIKMFLFGNVIDFFIIKNNFLWGK